MSCRRKATSPGNRRGPRGQDLLEDGRAGGQRAQEALLLAPDHVDDQPVLLGQGRVRGAQDADGGVHQALGARLVHAELAGPAHGAADDPAQHVAPALVGGQDPVRHQHRHGPAVVGHDAQPDVGRLVAAVRLPGDRLGHLEHRHVQVGVVERVDPLDDRQDPLEAGAGVDARAGQRLGAAVGAPVVLHEDQVPDLDEPLGAAEGRPAVGAVGRALVDEDLAARPAGAGVAHLPEVVVAQALDPLGPDAHGVAPDGLGLVVGLVDGHPQPVAVDAQDLGDELPGEGDGVGLEVVAEAEVPQHLEEGAVAQRGADDVDVDGAEALLHRRGPRPRRHLVAQEERLEGHHPGDGEQDRGVVRDEARRRHGGVARAPRRSG